MEKQLSGRYYYGLDLVKVMAAVFVIGAHTEPLLYCKNEMLQSVYGFFQDLAVPFFFLVSGFLLASRLEDDLHARENLTVIKGYLLRIGKLYLTWHLIYLPISIYGAIASGKPLYLAAARMAINYLFVGQQEYSWHLWYLLSTLYAAFFLLIMLKWKGKLWQLGLMALAALGFSAFLTEISGNLDQYSGIFRLIALGLSEVFLDGRLFTGTVYLTAGFLFARIRFRPNPWLCLGVLLFGLGLRLFRNPALPYFFRILLLLLYASCLFFLAVPLRRNAPTPFARFFRDTSTVLYFTHMLWYFLGMLLFKALPGVSFYGPVSFFWCLFWSLAAAGILHRYRSRKLVKALL